MILPRIRSKIYSNRDKKNAAYKVLVEKLEKRLRMPTVIWLQRKQTMCSLFRKEAKETEASQSSEAGSNEIYYPTLWYFEHLSESSSMMTSWCSDTK